ncbi:unnamed protein product [Oikopleura dioica]|uniref:Endonuclease/exonuclease/phosphatase domain-containing protein n=1 Tax=Oikopleura dioica TaxID=34765 RepID=E4X8E5_OIKDI|nr:unnamed protein product [Oikopleura dioica]
MTPKKRSFADLSPNLVNNESENKRLCGTEMEERERRKFSFSFMDSKTKEGHRINEEGMSPPCKKLRFLKDPLDAPGFTSDEEEEEVSEMTTLGYEPNTLGSEVPTCSPGRALRTMNLNNENEGVILLSSTDSDFNETQNNLEVSEMIVLPVQGKAFYSSHRAIYPLVQPDITNINEIVKEEELPIKGNESMFTAEAKKMLTSKDHFMPSAAIKKLSPFIGQPLTLFDFLISSETKIFELIRKQKSKTKETVEIVDEKTFRAWTDVTTKCSNKIAASLQSVAKRKNIGADSLKRIWLEACHHIASGGLVVLEKIKRSGLEKIANYPADKVLNAQKAQERLETFIGEIKVLHELYNKPRALAELFLLHPSGINFFLPICPSPTIYDVAYSLLKNKVESPKGFCFAYLALETRMRDIGIMFYHGKQEKSVYSVNEDFGKHNFQEMPICGMTKSGKEVSGQYVTIDAQQGITKIFNSMSVKYANLEPPKQSESIVTLRNIKASRELRDLIAAFIRSAAERPKFIENLVKKPVEFGWKKEYNNKIFSSLQSAEQELREPTRQRHPMWSFKASKLVPRQLLMKIPIKKAFDINKYDLEKPSRKQGDRQRNCTEQGRGLKRNRQAELNPSSQVEIDSAPKKRLCASVDKAEDDMGQLLLDLMEYKLADNENREFSKKLKKRVKKLSCETTENNISVCQTICKLMNEINIKEIKPGVRILSANVGKVTDSERLRLLTDSFPDVSIFLISEVYWPREEAQRPTNWPPNFHIATHDQIGTSLDSFSLIMWNKKRLPSLEIMPSVGTFTVLRIPSSTKPLIIAVGYRHNNKNPSKCWYNKTLGKDRYVFADWIEKLVKSYPVSKNRSFITGDFNFEELARTWDDPDLVSKIKKLLREFVNVVTRKTFYRSGIGVSSIDKIYASDPDNTKVKYLRLNEPPFSFDGHTGISFTVNAHEMPDLLEVHQVTKMASRSEIFGNGISMADNNAENNSFERNFLKLQEILEKSSSKSIVIKSKPNRIKFSYSRNTWNLINLCINIKASLPEHVKKGIFARKFFSMINIKINKLKKIDEVNHRNFIGYKVSKNKNTIWDVMNIVTEPPPIEELNYDQHELLKKSSSSAERHNYP